MTVSTRQSGKQKVNENANKAPAWKNRTDICSNGNEQK